MKSIKRPKFLFLLVSVLAGIGGIIGCSKLNEHVYSKETSSNFFQSKDQVMSAYVQPYAYIATHIYQVHFALSEFATDEAVAPERNGYLDQNGMWNRLHQHNWVVNDAWILSEWNDMYQAIGFANYFIDAVQNKDFTSYGLPIPKAQMVAEVKMVRDLHYYWLLDEFGNVPIVEHVGTVNPATSSRADVYTWLVNDIKTNLPLLGHKGDATWYGHFTQEAAHALLAKLYLNAKVFTGTDQYTACIAECEALINSGNFSLDATWNAPFLAHNESSSENILVVPFDVTSQPNFDAGQQQVHWDEGPPKYDIGDSWYKVVSQQSFYELYKPNDYRINQWLVGPQTYVDDNGVTQPVMDDDGNQLTLSPVIQSLENQSGGSYDGVSNVKYELEKTGSVYMNNDLVIFRLSDIMDMEAECLMRQNGGTATQAAVTLVNKVSGRSVGPQVSGQSLANVFKPYTIATLTLDELLNERGREFSYEMKRREDMIRFGHFNDAWWEKPVTDAHYQLYPIPYNAIVTNNNLKQNPGY